MKFGENEVKEHEYYFETGFFGGGTNDVSHMTTLTNRRLVVVWGNAEHSYPISKITAVKLIFHRSIKLVIGGGVVAVIGLASFSSNFLIGLIILAIGAAMIYFGWKGKTRLQIGQMGGNEYYTVRGKEDKKLIEFIDMVNSKLS